MPTTVASSKAIPEPRTVAATTQRPRAAREGERLGRRARRAPAPPRSASRRSLGAAVHGEGDGGAGLEHGAGGRALGQHGLPRLHGRGRHGRTVVVVDEVARSVVVVVAARRRGGRRLPTEKQAQVSPTAWRVCRAAAEGEPDDGGHVGAVAVAARPGDPDPRAGRHGGAGAQGHGTDAQVWRLARDGERRHDALAGSVPLLHGVFRPTRGQPDGAEGRAGGGDLEADHVGHGDPGPWSCVVRRRWWRWSVRRSWSSSWMRGRPSAVRRSGELPQDDEDAGGRPATAPTRRPGPRTAWLHHGSCARRRAIRRARPAWRYFKMLTARATTRIATTREMASSAIIMSFIQGLTADTSVGLKAVAVAKAKWK